MADHAKARGGWFLFLRAVILLLALCLVPVFFADMFVTVTDLVRPSFGWLAWTVPAATEGSFVVLYLLDLMLLLAGKPKGWLRLAPYPFAVVSLVLNVYASWGDLAAMLGHAVVTCAFFLPVLACEAAVRSLSASDEQVRLTAEVAAAMRHARDLVRDRRGPLWRWRVPSLLRTQILSARPPAYVADAIAEGARFGGGAKWEQPVGRWVTEGLTQRDLIAASVERRRADIASEVAQPSAGQSPDQASRPALRKTAQQAAGKSSQPAAEEDVRKPTRAQSKKMTAADLVPYVESVLRTTPALTQQALMDDLHIGIAKAREALRLARHNRLSVAK